MAQLGTSGMMMPPRHPDSGRETARSKRQSYRVERVKVGTQDKNKLKSILSFKTQPPVGYTFIPAGNPDLTQVLKDASRKHNLPIYAVTTTPHAKVHELSKEVHRVGFHFPSMIVAEICVEYGISLSRSGTIIEEEGAQNLQSLRRGGKKAASVEDQKKLNTQARDSIKDLFPNIPDNDLYQIIKTAFQKGDGKVGTANELPLVRRAQLSVVAHIRHVYTNYDRLLRTVGYHDARGKVESPTLKKLVEWRGDDNDGKAIEDVMKEVVVITDDDDSEDDGEDAPHMLELDVQRNENIVNGARPERRPDVQMQLLSPRDPDYNHQSEDETRTGYRYIPHAPRRRRILDEQHVDEGQYRQTAWQRARDEHRANPTNLQPVIVLENPSDDRQLRDQGMFNFNSPVARSRQDPLPLKLAPLQSRLREFEHHPTQHRTTTTLVRGEDGALYERTVTRQADPSSYPRQRASPTVPDRNGLVTDRFSVQPRIPSDRIQKTRGSSPRPRESEEMIVQSIEQGSPTTVRRSLPGPFSDTQDDSRILNASAGRREVIDLTDTSQQYLTRKRKLDDISYDDGHRGRLENLNDRFQLLRPRADDILAGSPSHAERRPVRLERVVTELAPQRLAQRQYVDPSHQVQPARVSRATNHGPEQRAFPSTPLSTSYRPVEVSSAPSHFSAFPDSAPVRVQQYAQSFRQLSPPRASFTPLRATDTQSVRHSYIAHDPEPIELVSENRASYDRGRVLKRAWPTEPIRAYPPEHREQAEVFSRQTRDDQFLHSQARQVIELVPLSRTFSHDDQYIRSRREYLPAHDPPSAVPIRRSFEGFPENHEQRGELEYARVYNIAPGDRRYDRPLQQTHVQTALPQTYVQN